MSRCRLYLISPPALEPEQFIGPLEAALGGGDVASFQLRLTGARDDAVLKTARILKPIVQQAGADVKVQKTQSHHGNEAADLH